MATFCPLQEITESKYLHPSLQSREQGIFRSTCSILSSMFSTPSPPELDDGPSFILPDEAHHCIPLSLKSLRI